MTRRKRIDTTMKELPCDDCAIPVKVAGDAVAVVCVDCTQKRLAVYNRTKGGKRAQ